MKDNELRSIAKSFYKSFGGLLLDDDRVVGQHGLLGWHQNTIVAHDGVTIAFKSAQLINHVPITCVVSS